MIKKIRRTHHFIIIFDKSINEKYKFFAIDDENYLYNYLWYSFIKDHESKLKVKKFEEILTMIYKLIIDTLFSNSIFFIDNYFFELKMIRKFMIVKIVVCEIMKSNRINISKLFVKIK